MSDGQRVLVLGAAGFIGSHLAASLSCEGWQVRAGARRPAEAARRAPTFDWAAADFARLTTAEAWAPLLVGVDAVINCVGVLQDGAGDSTRLAHVEGPRALIAACERAGVRRLVHISAVGADDAAGTAYARTKAESERLVEASGLDWLILRPSLVVDRAAFGGTGLIRALAAFPLFSPVVGGDQVFRPIALGDLGAAVVAALKPGAPNRESFDMPGPEAVTMAEAVRLYRGWLGLPSAPVVRVPRALAAPVLAIGDLLGRLGWSSPIRTTAMRQMDHDVSGQDSGWAERLGVRASGFSRFLAETPASVQDVWHARLWFVRPVSILTLGLFWLSTDAFVAVINSDLTASANDRLTYYGGAGDDSAADVKIVDGKVWLTGISDRTVGAKPEDPTSGYLARLNPQTGAVEWSQTWTGADRQAAPMTIAVASGGASVLDKLGLPQGEIPQTDSRNLVDATSLRTGDRFYVTSGTTGRSVAVTIDAKETLQTLARKIETASGRTLKVTIKTDKDHVTGLDGDTKITAGGVQRLSITYADGREGAVLRAGEAGRDALAGLGLTAGYIGPSSSDLKTFGLDLPKTLSLKDAEAAKTATSTIQLAVKALRDAYKALDPDNSKPKATGAVPPYLKAQLANYQAALARLTG